jgi:hypothetical protein
MYQGSHMPWDAYKRVSDDDLRAIYRYLMGLEPSGVGARRRHGSGGGSVLPAEAFPGGAEELHLATQLGVRHGPQLEQAAAGVGGALCGRQCRSRLGEGRTTRLLPLPSRQGAAGLPLNSRVENECVAVIGAREAL